MASAPDAQADTGVCTPAFAPISMPMAAAGPFGMSMGTVSGKMRRGPFSLRTSSAESRVQTPPIPEATTAPSRSDSTSGLPASAQASRAATIAIWPEGSRRRVSTRLRVSDVGTASCAAKVTGISYCCTQSAVIGRAPDRPSSAAFQLLGRSPPSGLVAPRPVTTTFRGVVSAMTAPRSCRSGAPPEDVLWAASALRALDVRHRVADGLEVLDVVVGDPDAELLLGVDHDRHHRQRVDVEVVGEVHVGLDGVGGQAGLLVDDLGQTAEDLLLALCHALRSFWCRRVSSVWGTA